MTGAVRVAAFALVIAAAFAAALGLGRAVGPIDRSSSAARDDGHAAAAAEDLAAPATSDGLSVAAGGLRLVASETTLEAARPQPFSFRIVHADGSPLRAYDLAHERRMHLIVVRRDLTRFQHLHPRMRADGTWTTTIAPSSPGAYRAFADFTTNGRKATLGIDLFVPGEWAPLPLPGPSVVSGYSDDYSVELLRGDRVAGRETALRFDVRGPDRRSATLDPYLGALGHLVILREGDLAYLHTHAEHHELSFETTFPTAGNYRAFLQYSAGGSVRTAAFTVEVEQ